MSDFQEVVIKDEPTGAEAPVVLSSTPRPVEVPENFWDPVKGEVKMAELLAAATAPKEEEAKPVEEAKPEAEEATPEEAEADRLAKEAGVDVAAVEAAYLETGEIPADVYEKLGKIGISKDLVNEFVQSRVSQADRLRDEVLGPYGGNEGVGKMVDWAAKNWTQAQADAFNTAVNGGNRGQMELALKGLKADFEKSNGIKPTLIQGSGGSPSTTGSFNSIQELAAAQRDPRYKTDPAYQAAVFEKLRRSKI